MPERAAVDIFRSPDAANVDDVPSSAQIFHRAKVLIATHDVPVCEIGVCLFCDGYATMPKNAA